MSSSHGDQRRTTHQWVRLVMKILLAVIVLALADLVARLALPSLEPSVWGPSLRRFLTSPGAGGVAAIIAATIGASALYVQLLHTRSKDRNQAWWSAFEWATERAAPSKQDNHAIPVSLSVNLINSLQQSATDVLQQRACGGFVDHIVALAELEKPEQEQPQRNFQAPTFAANEVELRFGALCAYVKATLNTKSASLLAEDYVEERQYKKQVREALDQLGANKTIDFPDNERPLPAGTYVKQYDAVCEINGEEIVIQVVGGATSNLETKVKARVKDLLKRYKEIDLPLLIVNPVGDALKDVDSRGVTVISIAWREASGSAALAKAIQDVATLARQG